MGTSRGQSETNWRQTDGSAWSQWPNTMGTSKECGDKLGTDWGHTGDSAWSQRPNIMGTNKGQRGDTLGTDWG